MGYLSSFRQHDQNKNQHNHNTQAKHKRSECENSHHQKHIQKVRVCSSILMSNQGEKHFLVVSTGVLSNGTVQRDAIPLVIIIFYYLQVNFSPCNHNSGESTFICSLLVYSQTKNILEVLLRIGQALHCCSQNREELVLGICLQVLQNIVSRYNQLYLRPRNRIPWKWSKRFCFSRGCN